MLSQRPSGSARCQCFQSGNVLYTLYLNVSRYTHPLGLTYAHTCTYYVSYNCEDPNTPNLHALWSYEQNQIRDCLLHLGTETFVFPFAIYNIKTEVHWKMKCSLLFYVGMKLGKLHERKNRERTYSRRSRLKDFGGNWMTREVINIKPRQILFCWKSQKECSGHRSWRPRARVYVCVCVCVCVRVTERERERERGKKSIKFVGNWGRKGTFSWDDITNWILKEEYGRTYS